MLRTYRFRAWRLAAVCAVVLGASPGARASSAAQADAVEAEGALARWWNGNGLTAPDEGPFGFLREHGVVFGGTYYGAVFGIQESEGGAATPYDQGAELNLDTMPARLLGLPALEGLVLTVEGRWRAELPSDDPNTYVQASAAFAPSNWGSGVGWRFLQANASYGRRLDARPDTEVWLKGGWVQPRYEFLLQPSSEKFLNTAVASAKGLGANIPFSSSFSTWGGMGRVSTPDAYAKAGVFMAYPDADASDNHGQQFGGSPPHNSVMSLAEIGATPSLRGRPGSPAALPGKYVVGGYLYDNADGATTSGGSANFGLQGGVYLQADQLVYREPDGAGDVPARPQGLVAFGVLMWAPPRNDDLQLYFHAGLDWTGAVPTRNLDSIVASFAYGNWSRSTHTETIVVEGGYHVALNRWLELYPYLQYDIRPDGTSKVANAFIIGCGTGVTF